MAPESEREFEDTLKRIDAINHRNISLLAAERWWYMYLRAGVGVVFTLIVFFLVKFWL